VTYINGAFGQDLGEAKFSLTGAKAKFQRTGSFPNVFLSRIVTCNVLISVEVLGKVKDSFLEKSFSFAESS
jgi:hypothetical protein